MLFLLRIIITTLAVLAIAHMIPGLVIKDYTDALIFGVILAIINSSVRPVLVLLTLPITFFTLGLFLLVINSFTFWLASEVSYGVHVETLSAAIWGGLVIWITGFFTNRLIWDTETY